MEKRVILDWIGPFNWTREEDGNCIFDAPFCNNSGLYIFTIPYQGSYLSYYIGQTGRSFAIRFQEHTKEYLPGVYRTYDPVEFMQGRKKIVWDGLWKKDRRHLWPEFLDGYVELAPIIRAFLTCFRLFLAPLETDNTLRLRVENAIGNTLREHNDVTRLFFDDALKFYVKKSNLVPIIVVNNCSEKIIGLQQEIVA